MQAQSDQESGRLPPINDIGSISIFKSKNDYEKLRKTISDHEMLLIMFNYLLLIGIGVIPAVLSLIDMVFPWPFAVYMSIKLQEQDHEKLLDKLDE